MACGGKLKYCSQQENQILQLRRTQAVQQSFVRLLLITKLVKGKLHLEQFAEEKEFEMRWSECL